MRLDDDDLYDYDEQDSFDEEGAIAEVVEALKPEGVTETQAEAELDKVDWDIDVAIANLRKRLAKPKPKPQEPAKGKLTPLQMLAQRRKQTDTTPNETGPPPPEDSPSQSEQAPQKLSLAQLAAQRRTKTDSDTKSSALEKLRQRKSGNRSTPEPPITQTAQDPKTTQQSIDRSKSAIPPNTRSSASVPKWEPEISFALPATSDLGKPSVLGAVIGISQATPAKWNKNTNSLATAKSAASEFSKPSPDDRVLNAQSEAFKPKPKGQAKHESKNEKKEDSKNDTKTDSKDTNKNNAKESGLSNKSMAAMQASSTAKTTANGLVSRLQALDLKPSCSFVVIGHVDAGKSTLMGRLLLDTGALNPKLVQKYEHESAKLGKQSFWLAWAMDATNEERERGVTVDIGEASFATKTTNFTVLDAPGHKDYVPNMIAGVTQADLAVLVVDSDTNAFESGFSLDGQTKEHAVLSRSLGIDRVIVAVNKMDTQGWEERRFVEICAQLTEFLTKKVGFQPDQIVYVPTSGMSGANVVNRVPKGSDPKWYTGPSLVEALDEVAHSRQEEKSKTSQPLRFSVSNAYTEPFQSTITVTGRVLTGCVEVGDAVEIVNSHEPLRIKSITGREFLIAGDQAELKLAFENGGDDASGQGIRPGDVIGGFGAQLKTSQQFVAKVRLFDLPRPILPGTPLAFHLGRVEDTVKVVSILGSLDPKQAKKKLRHLGKGSAARVVFQLSKPTVLATPGVCKDLGRFVLRVNGATVGGGVVEETEVAAPSVASG